MKPFRIVKLVLEADKPSLLKTNYYKPELTTFESAELSGLDLYIGTQEGAIIKYTLIQLETMKSILVTKQQITTKPIIKLSTIPSEQKIICLSGIKS
jgi:hypothetical protein